MIIDYTNEGIHRCSSMKQNQKIERDEVTKEFVLIKGISCVIKNINFCPYCGKHIRKEMKCTECHSLKDCMGCRNE